MQNKPDTSSSPQQVHWAASLRDTLLRREQGFDKEYMAWAIEFWQDALKGKYRHSTEEWYRTSAQNLSKWYWNEVNVRSYQAPNWKISPERTMLFRQFREDPYYILKNLTEIVVRDLIEATLTSEGYDVEVMTTSDSDDVFCGVDIMIGIKEVGKTRYIGLDIAISQNEYYLTQKGKRSQTICREFNAYKWHGKLVIPRQVFSISPHVMSMYLRDYMALIVKWEKPDTATILKLRDSAKERNARDTKESVRTSINNIITQ